MPFFGPEASTSISWNGIVDAATHTTPSTATTDALPGAATWPPSAASLSTAQSHMDSSAPVGIAEINLVSSPPTSHATSPLRPSARNNLPSPSELRAGSKAALSTATAARLESAFVANSDPEDGGEIEADGADTPRDRSGSPEQEQVPESTVYVQLPASSPSMAVHSGSASRRKSKGASGSDSPKRRRRGSKSSEASQPGASSVVDDAALAAQLAAQEAALARGRPTRGSRKDVSYSPVCDLDGKRLRNKQGAAAAPASSSASTSKDKLKSKKTPTPRKVSGKRRSRVFSDDEDEDEHADAGSSGAAPAKASAAGEEQHDADLTDEDVGFQAHDRKKPRKSKRGGAEDAQEPDAARAEASTRGSKGKPRRRRDEDEEEVHSDASGGGGDDGILTPPAPKSPRQSGKRNASPKVQAAEPASKSPASESQVAERQGGDGEERENEESAGSPRALAASEEAAASVRTTPATPATVAIKRVGTTSSPGGSPSARSFFGKPLTSLLTGTVRRPGLTRKTNIPSLLAHRTAPKPPAPKLAVSKRRMQDDDYEYDAAYEALIAKPEPGSDDEEGAAEDQVEHEEEYD
ncbi:hypothetical protein L1887_42109 [Cichorium endivia]|nr:hypothetical protein L1887_42109 [Cichorium endivia]